MSTTPDDNEDGSGLHDPLAAEYALGLLEGEDLLEARLRFVNDPAFRKDFADWQQKFDPMLDEFTPVQAPASAWRGINQKLFEANESAQQQPTGIFSALNFWRGLSFASLAVIAGLIAALFYAPSAIISPTLDDGRLYATLRPAADKPAFIIKTGTKPSVIEIQPLNFVADQNSVAELWIIPADGTPRSLGLIAKQGNTTLDISQDYIGFFQPGALLAVSIEPQGGAPEGKPTGPIIATGKILEI